MFFILLIYNRGESNMAFILGQHEKPDYEVKVTRNQPGQEPKKVDNGKFFKGSIFTCDQKGKDLGGQYNESVIGAECGWKFLSNA